MNRFLTDSLVATIAPRVNSLYYEFKDYYTPFIKKHTAEQVAHLFAKWLAQEKRNINTEDFKIGYLEKETTETFFTSYEQCSDEFKNIRNRHGKDISFLFAVYELWKSNASNIRLNIFLSRISSFIHANGLKRKKKETIPQLLKKNIKEAFKAICDDAERAGMTFQEYTDWLLYE